jgi:hypothetical protein
MDGWEKSRWPGGRLAPKSVYSISYPKSVVEQFKQLLAQAKKEAAPDALATKRLTYFSYCFDDFFKEYAAVMEGEGQRTIKSFKVAANPIIDGTLDDAVWQKSHVNIPLKYDLCSLSMEYRSALR